MKPTMSKMAAALVIAATAWIAPANSDEPPTFIQEIFPEQGVNPAWQTYRSVFLDEEAALDARTKELIALAVAAQVPCEYCVYYHTKASKAQGATEAQIKEALASSALVRKWSTMLNGSRYSEAKWREEVDAMFPAD